MKKKIIIIFLFFISLILVGTNNKTQKVKLVNANYKDINYRAHVQDIGWMDYKKNGETSGTTGQSKRLEAIIVNLEEEGIEYTSYVEGEGWQDYKKDGELSGTMAKSKRLEAVKIRLYGDIEENYDVYYRVHVQEFGWLGWAKNDEISGTIGYNYRIEAVEIKILDKEEEIKQDSRSYYTPLVKYQTHIQDNGWQDYRYDGKTSGTTGQSKRLEGIKIDLNSEQYEGNIEYSSYIEGSGWQDYVSDNTLSGTTGQSKRLEAIKIRLTGEIANHYDVYYRVHSQLFGWLGWTKNDEISGTIGYDYRMEAIEIKLLDKDNKNEEESQSYRLNLIKYKSHVQDIGWLGYEKEGDTSGTTGKSKRLEAFKIELIDGDDIEYKSYIEESGWEEYRQNNEISGTTGQSKRLEAIKINLKGDTAEKYDIYYRVHVENFGWLGWAKNGEASGTIGYNYRIEALQIKLLKKGEELNSDAPFYDKKINYSSHVSDIGWMNYKSDGETSGTTGESRRLEGIKINLLDDTYHGDIEYKSLINGFGWEDSYRKNGEISGTTGKSKTIEAIQIRLTGDISDYYDICYRVYIQNKGWLGWTQNGNITGSSGYSYRLEAIQIKLVKKEDEHPPISDDVYYMTKEGYYNISVNNSYLDSTTKSGSAIHLSEKNELKNQIWKIKDYNDGTFRIFSSTNPKLALQANNSLTLSKYQNTPNEIFKIQDLGNGYYDIETNEGKKINELLNTNGDFKIEPFTGTKTYRGIDISKWQGNINWEELINENPEFIIMRVGTGKNNYEKDSKFEEYYSSASYYNIPVGTYTYSMALNMKDALKEAEKTIEWLGGKQLDLPVFYDIENINQTILGKDVLTKIAETFCEKIKENGYKCGIYANKYFLIDHLDTEELSKYFIWLAHWTGANDYADAETENFKTDYNLSKYNYWQFSSLGVYKGINENTVDLDLGYDIFD